MTRPRVAILSPYWSFWERSVPGDLRADRRALSSEAAALLEGVDVVAVEAVEDRESGAAAAERIRAAAPDALLVVQSMAVPPAYTLAALDPLDGVPLVVLVVQRRHGLPDGFTHADVTAEGGTVGGPQLTNVLERLGRRYDLVVGSIADPGLGRRLRGAVRSACAAGRLRGARLGRVGRPLDGYDCVDVDDADLVAALGLDVVHIEPATVREAYLAADPARADAIEAETRAAFALGPGVEDDECLSRSLRFAAALERLDGDLGLAAGAMNCHVPELRFADEPGITPCFALGRETTRGIPWTCVGDVLTAVAMIASKLLGGAALYHELEAIDHETGELVIANSGEHDLAFADPGARPELRRNVWFDGVDPRCGACACFGPPAGPGTLVAFTPHPDAPAGFRFVVAEGELTTRTFPMTGTVNGAFRFAAGPAAETWAAWARAGVNHHSAATPGLLGDAVARLATHLGVGCVRL